METKVIGLTEAVRDTFDRAKKMQQEARQRMQRDPESGLAYARAAARKMEEAVELSRKTGDEAENAR